MRAGHVSQTALIVCAARATIHQHPTIAGFADPYAERLLPRAYKRPLGRVVRRLSKLGSHIIALRCVAIDEAVRTAPQLSQLVILGAGLDARAWRMPELERVRVFEVDHPDTQAYKLRRAADFPTREEHVYVPVDFTRDSLDAQLEAAGHDPELPTMWIWEGVTMYLDVSDIEATLGVLRDRSPEGSRLAVTYLPPGALRKVIGFVTSIVGEQFRATFEPPALAELLERFGFEVVLDESSVDWHERWAMRSAPLLPGFGATERLATADRRAT